MSTRTFTPFAKSSDQLIYDCIALQLVAAVLSGHLAMSRVH